MGEHIGIYFGTDSGTTRLIAKKIARALQRRVGEATVARPLNVNRTDVEAFRSHPALILGTPTYGEGLLPGKASRNSTESWLEFLPRIEAADFTGTRIALYGLGDQEQYPGHFLDAMGTLHQFFTAAGAELVGGCSTAGYQFTASKAVVDDHFLGLALDQHLQERLTESRIETWLDEVVPLLMKETTPARAAV